MRLSGTYCCFSFVVVLIALYLGNMEPGTTSLAASQGAVVEYDLPGDATYQSKLYPPPELIDPKHNLVTFEKVVEHFTRSSLETDGIEIVEGSLHVTNVRATGRYRVSFLPKPGYEDAARHYAKIHPQLLDQSHAGQAIKGAEACQATYGCWNPMAGFKVNRREFAEWHLYLPLGMPMVNQKAVTLLHYPPYVAMQNADYLHNMTLWRWQRLLHAVGLPEKQQSLYYTILDVNPIAAPGSGQAEYPNDYFPIMLSSVYFDNEKQNGNYIRPMLETLLNPPYNSGSDYTLPLLVGGSPLYDPQAPGWFRVRYKDALPKNKETGVPQLEVLQTGTVRINSGSKKLTPYIAANHMIAAGVTGKCTSDAGKIPDIRRYEAEDLVAACFLTKYAADSKTKPDDAKKSCCDKWFGNALCVGPPVPTTTPEKKQICLLARTDLFFNGNKIEPLYTTEQVEYWCEHYSGGTLDPCYQNNNHPQ